MPIADTRSLSNGSPAMARDLSSFGVSVTAGQVDQSGALQNAFNSGDPLAVSAANGPVTLYISSPLTISQNGFYLAGASGPNQVNPLVTIKAMPGYGGDMLIIAAGCTDGVLDGVTLDGGGTGTLGSGAASCIKGIGTNAGTRWRFRRVRTQFAQNQQAYNTITAVGAIGSQTVTLTNPIPSAYLGVGTVIRIQDSVPGNSEYVTVTAVTTVGSNVTQFTATYANTHGAGTLIIINNAPVGAGVLFIGNVFQQSWTECYSYNNVIGLWGTGAQGNGGSYANNKFSDCHYQYNCVSNAGGDDTFSAQVILGDAWGVATANFFDEACEFGRGTQAGSINAIGLKLSNSGTLDIVAGQWEDANSASSTGIEIYQPSPAATNNRQPYSPFWTGTPAPTNYVTPEVKLQNCWTNGNNVANYWLAVIYGASLIEMEDCHTAGYKGGGTGEAAPTQNQGASTSAVYPISNPNNALITINGHRSGTRAYNLHRLYLPTSTTGKTAPGTGNNSLTDATSGWVNLLGYPVMLLIVATPNATGGTMSVAVGLGPAKAPATLFTTTALVDTITTGPPVLYVPVIVPPDMFCLITTTNCSIQITVPTVPV